MNMNTNFAVLDKVNLPSQKVDRIQQIITSISGNISFDKAQIIRTVLENTERLITLKKSMESGMSASDIEIFSNVVSVVIPKFQENTITDKLVTVQPAKTPYPVIYYVDFEYGDAYTDSPAFGNAAETYVSGQAIQGTRSLTYGNVSEYTQGRTIKASVYSKSITTVVKRINAEWTLESIIALASVLGLENASNFVDQRLTNAIYTKLKDEVEFGVLNDLWNQVPAANQVEFEVSPAAYLTDPVLMTEYRKSFSDTMENLSADIFKIYSVKPNWIVIGPTAYNLMAREKIQLVADPKTFVGALGRFYLGVFDMAWQVVYDPWMPGVLMGCNYPEAEISSGIFAPFLIGNTPPITQENANTYRIIYRADAFDVVLPKTLGRITFK